VKIKNDYYTLKKVVEVNSKIAVPVRTEGDIHSLLASILSDKTLVLSMDAGREKAIQRILIFYTYLW